jgi:hypothetical protein
VYMQPFLQCKISKYYIFWVCICRHAQYCHLWPVRLYSIFPHYLMNCMNF